MTTRNQLEFPFSYPCPICNGIGNHMVNHHWIEEDGSLHKAYICNSCNGTLKSSCSIALGDHVLPSWGEQVRFVRESIKAKTGEIVEKYEQGQRRFQEEYGVVLTRHYMGKHPEVVRLVKLKQEAGYYNN